jgi:LacI family transcriptional regulator
MAYPNKPNIYELAKMTGYSVSTVSKALNNTGRISAETRKKILDKATEMNYVASYYAKTLSLKKSWIIGVIYSDNLGIGFAHPHFSAILNHFRQTVEEAGYEITFINRNMGNRLMSYLEFCQYRRVEGVFVVNYYSLSKQIPELIKSGLPLVSADSGFDDITTITSDDVLGGKMAAEYLIQLGHKKHIVHIAGPLNTVSAINRKKGFIDAVMQHGVSQHTVYEANNFGVEDGYEVAVEILKNKSLPSAIFASGDWLALGAMKAFREHGIRIPEDISIIGYDNLDFLSYSLPGLTTVAQDKQTIGRIAAKSLLAQINNEPTNSQLIPLSIVERDTCQPFKQPPIK